VPTRAGSAVGVCGCASRARHSAATTATVPRHGRSLSPPPQREAAARRVTPCHRHQGGNSVPYARQLPPAWVWRASQILHRMPHPAMDGDAHVTWVRSAPISSWSDSFSRQRRQVRVVESTRNVARAPSESPEWSALIPPSGGHVPL
jgi:hypothetical protein